MADKDLGQRGKEEEAAYFVPRFAESYAFLGTLGHRYAFSKKVPAKVTLPCDLELFRSKTDLIECSAGGTALKSSGSGIAKPLSYSKTEPPDLRGMPPASETVNEVGEKSEVMTSDKPKKKGKKKKKRESEPEEDAWNDEDL